MGTDSLLLFKLISDTGLLVLIWLVQLVIYPGFKYYKLQNLKKWHFMYSGKITIVVLPLMLSQLILSCWLTFKYDWELFFTISTVLVVLTWVSTFITFVPLHQKIDAEDENLTVHVQKLITYNWVRTFLWTSIFLMTVIYMIS